MVQRVAQEAPVHLLAAIPVTRIVMGRISTVVRFTLLMMYRTAVLVTRSAPTIMAVLFVPPVSVLLPVIRVGVIVIAMS